MYFHVYNLKSYNKISNLHHFKNTNIGDFHGQDLEVQPGGGGLWLGDCRIFHLLLADDVVLMAS